MNKPLVELRKVLTDWQILKLAEDITDVMRVGYGEVTLQFYNGRLQYVRVTESRDRRDRTLDNIEQ